MTRIVKKTIGWVVYLSILVGLVFGTPRILSYVLKTPYPMASITSGSMWPALKKGDLVLIKGVSGKNEITLDDVVVYTNEMGFTIHRVIELNEQTLVTKGDANNTADSPIAYNEVVGRAVEWGQKPFRIPFLGNISLFISKTKSKF